MNLQRYSKILKDTHGDTIDNQICMVIFLYKKIEINILKVLVRKE